MTGWKGRYYQGLLAARFGLLNIGAVGLLMAAWMQGYPQIIIEADTSRICLVIVAMVAWGLLLAGTRSWQIGHALDRLSTGEGWSTPLPHGGDVARLQDRIQPIQWLTGAAALLGLIGTVVGFVVALQGVNQESIADVNAISGVISNLVHGMGIALYTTLVGALGSLWLDANVRLLKGGVARLERAIKWGEQ